MRQHIFYGALYHLFVMYWNLKYPHFRPHRALSVHHEFALNLKRLILMPILSIKRRPATPRIWRGSFPYHLALRHLEHDASFQMHSPFTKQREFLDLVISRFSTGAQVHRAIHDRLVLVSRQPLDEFFAHPTPGAPDQYRQFREFVL